MKIEMKEEMKAISESWYRKKRRNNESGNQSRRKQERNENR